jgi:hypothetical protein
VLPNTEVDSKVMVGDDRSLFPQRAQSRESMLPRRTRAVNMAARRFGCH